MTCLTGKLKDVPCILCQQADQVYIGHGKARFCAHCSITWDPIEDNSSIEGKSVIFADDAVDGQLPEDIVSRMGVLAGSIQTVFAFEDRLTEVMSIPEILFTENGAKKAEGLLKRKHKPGRHAQSSHGRGGARRRPRGEGISGSKVSPEMRVWQGQQHEKPDNPLTKLQQGELGERIATKALSDKYGVAFEGLNVGRNNAALDVKGDHLGVEVKAGMGYNGERSRSWRSKLGEAGPLQKKRLAGLPPEQRKAEFALKRTEILNRKADMLQQLSSEAGGERFTGKMVGVIMAPDGRSADAFEVDGFHLYLGWGRHARSENYLGTYEVGQDVFDTIMSKAIQLAKAITRASLLAMDHPLENVVLDYEMEWFTPAQVALLRYPIIWWSLEAHEADTIDVFTSILLGKNIDPETITEAELTALWNITFPEMHTESAQMFKHLRGRHDQRTHGRGGRGRGMRSSKILDTDLKAQLDVIYGPEIIDMIDETMDNFKHGGLKTKLTEVDFEKGEVDRWGDTYPDALTVKADIVDRDGVAVGRNRRVFYSHADGRKTVYEDALYLDSPKQGAGFGRAYMAQSEQGMRQAGISEIELLANSSIGGYAWARMGYEPSNRDRFDRDVVSRVRGRWENRWGEFPLTGTITAKALSELQGPDGEKVGRAGMLSTGWPAIKYLGGIDG